MKITLPEGFTPPKDSRPGEPFEVVATLRPEDDGSFALVAVDGVTVPEEEEEADEDPMEEDRTDASRIRLPFGEDESGEYA